MARTKHKVPRGNPPKSGKFLTRKDEAVRWFQRNAFEPAEFISLLRSERELDQARNDLTQLNEYCKQEVQKVVHDHHKDFLEASHGIQDLEALVDELRNYVSGSGAVVANLAELPALPKQLPLASLNLGPSSLAAEDPPGSSKPATVWDGILAMQADLMQDLQVAVAEKDYSTARELLGSGHDMIAIVDRDAGLLAPQASGEGIAAWRYGFEGALAAQKAALIEDLQQQLLQINASTLELRQAAQTLGLLVGPGQATQALLHCHTLRMHAAQQHLLKEHSAVSWRRPRRGRVRRRPGAADLPSHWSRRGGRPGGIPQRSCLHRPLLHCCSCPLLCTHIFLCRGRSGDSGAVAATRRRCRRRRVRGAAERVSAGGAVGGRRVAAVCGAAVPARAGTVRGDGLGCGRVAVRGAGAGVLCSAGVQPRPGAAGGVQGGAVAAGGGHRAASPAATER